MEGKAANCKCQTPGKSFLCSPFSVVSLGSGKNFTYNMGYSFSRTFPFCTTSLIKVFILGLSELSLAFLIWFRSILLCLYSRINFLADSNRKPSTCSKRHLLCRLLISCWTFNKDINSVLIQSAELKPCRSKPLRGPVNQVQPTVFQGFSPWPFKLETEPELWSDGSFYAWIHCILTAKGICGSHS